MSRSSGRKPADEGSGVASRGIVLDSSALLCVLNGERGAERVITALQSAVIGAVSLAEVVTKLREKGLSAEEVGDVIGGLHLDVHPFSSAQAYAAGHLRPGTRAQGLSLGDRACLALAAELGAVVLTKDQAWAGVDAGVQVELLR